MYARNKLLGFAFSLMSYIQSIGKAISFPPVAFILFITSWPVING